MARIRAEDIDALRESADVIEVISGYSALKRAGTNTFKGLCPFHAEKSPSFSVDAVKGLWHCFGCGEGGDVYHFVQRAENLPFPEAVEWLARKSGFVLRYEEMRPGDRKAAGLKLRLIAANEEAQRFFSKALMTSPDAAPARRYLAERSFGREVAERWQLGWGPGRDALCKHLLGRGFSEKEIVTADLGRRSERDGALYDTFRGRVIFPTWNLQGDVAGFGARALGDVQPKYLNTAETPLFQKSRLMYGLNRAKSAIARSSAVVVEGYTDVIALHEAGVVEAVATNGVALGETHFQLLKKFTERIVLMFDADEAGKGATERGFDLQHKLGLEVLVAPLPPGRDPADLAQQEGPDAIRKVIDSAQPLMEFKLEQTISKLTLDTPEARGRAVRTVAEVLGWHPDPVARHEYAFTAARRIGVDPDAIQRELSERRGSGLYGTSEDEGRSRRIPGHVKVEREALQLLLTRPQEAVAHVENVTEMDFTSPARRELFRVARASSTPLDGRSTSDLSPDALSLFAELAVGAGSEPDGEMELRMREVFVRLRVLSLERDIKARRATLQDVNPLNDPDKHDALFTELVALEAERRDLLRMLATGRRVDVG
jgi:DNA primase